jgi:hypothetical protein
MILNFWSTDNRTPAGRATLRRPHRKPLVRSLRRHTKSMPDHVPRSTSSPRNCHLSPDLKPDRAFKLPEPGKPLHRIRRRPRAIEHLLQTPRYRRHVSTLVESFTPRQLPPTRQKPWSQAPTPHPQRPASLPSKGHSPYRSKRSTGAFDAGVPLELAGQQAAGECDRHGPVVVVVTR